MTTGEYREAIAAAEAKAPGTRTRAEIELVADAIKGDMYMCHHHNRHLIPAMERKLEALRQEWREAAS